MKLDHRQLRDRIEHQTDPELFSGVVYLSREDEVLFEHASGPAIRPESIPNRVGFRPHPDVRFSRLWPSAGWSKPAG